MLGDSPSLVDFSVTGEEDISYNCIGWSVGRLEHVWPPDLEPGDERAVFDAFYQEAGFVLSEALPGEEADAIALYSSDLGPQHAARRLATDPAWWESKLGKDIRIVHRLEELEGGIYGRVVAFYTRQKGANE